MKAASAVTAQFQPAILARAVQAAVRAVDDAALSVDQEHQRVAESHRLRQQQEQVTFRE